MEDAFKAREKALEDHFFRAVDRALVERMREGIAHDNCLKRLRESTGIRDERLLDELLEAGVEHATLIAFMLLPLARVAWADGRVDDKEREVVLNTATAVGCNEECGQALLSHWLVAAPDEELFEIWRDYAAQIAENLTHISRTALATTIIERSEAVARATGGLLGVGSISHAEGDVIKQIRAAFPLTGKEIP